MPGVGVDPDGSGKRLVALGRFGRRNMPGLRAAFLQWRGPGKVTFDPWFMEGVDDHMPDFVPPKPAPDGRVTTTARFSDPGTYVIRVFADDGSLLSTPVDLHGDRERHCAVAERRRAAVMGESSMNSRRDFLKQVGAAFAVASPATASSFTASSLTQAQAPIYDLVIKGGTGRRSEPEAVDAA
ncbi:MAG: twin-arginine translocation signal domain-containing protein [Vicinamibacterales bacterium]